MVPARDRCLSASQRRSTAAGLSRGGTDPPEHARPGAGRGVGTSAAPDPGHLRRRSRGTGSLHGHDHPLHRADLAGALRPSVPHRCDAAVRSRPRTHTPQASTFGGDGGDHSRRGHVGDGQRRRHRCRPAQGAQDQPAPGLGCLGERAGLAGGVAGPGWLGCMDLGGDAFLPRRRGPRRCRRDLPDQGNEPPTGTTRRARSGPRALRAGSRRTPGPRRSSGPAPH